MQEETNPGDIATRNLSPELALQFLGRLDALLRRRLGHLCVAVTVQPVEGDPGRARSTSRGPFERRAGRIVVLSVRARIGPRRQLGSPVCVGSKAGRAARSAFAFATFAAAAAAGRVVQTGIVVLELVEFGIHAKGRQGIDRVGFEVVAGFSSLASAATAREQFLFLFAEPRGGGFALAREFLRQGSVLGLLLFRGESSVAFSLAELGYPGLLRSEAPLLVVVFALEAVLLALLACRLALLAQALFTINVLLGARALFGVSARGGEGIFTGADLAFLLDLHEPDRLPLAHGGEAALGHVDGARRHEEFATRFGVLDVLLDLPPAGVQVRDVSLERLAPDVRRRLQESVTFFVGRQVVGAAVGGL